MNYDVIMVDDLPCFSDWKDPASTPIEDIRYCKREIHKRTRQTPTLVHMSIKRYQQLLDHPDIVGRIEGGRTDLGAAVVRANLCKLFEVEEIQTVACLECFGTGLKGGFHVPCSKGCKPS